MKRLGFLGFLVLCFLSAPAVADEIPRGLGHTMGEEHWYDNSCCSRRDCEPVELGAIRHTPEGYVIRYMTSRGYIAEGFLARNASGVKVSKDAQEHACAPFEKVVCIYLPMTM